MSSISKATEEAEMNKADGKQLTGTTGQRPSDLYCISFYCKRLGQRSNM